MADKRRRNEDGVAGEGPIGFSLPEFYKNEALRRLAGIGSVGWLQLPEGPAALAPHPVTATSNNGRAQASQSRKSMRRYR